MRLKFKMICIIATINLTDKVCVGKAMFSSTTQIKCAREAETLPTDAYEKPNDATKVMHQKDIPKAPIRRNKYK